METLQELIDYLDMELINDLDMFRVFTARWETLSVMEQMLSVWYVSDYMITEARHHRDRLIRDGYRGINFIPQFYIDFVIRNWENVPEDREEEAAARWREIATSGELTLDPRYQHARAAFMGELATAVMRMDTGLTKVSEVTGTDACDWNLLSLGPPYGEPMPLFAERGTDRMAIVISDYQCQQLARTFAQPDERELSDYAHLPEELRAAALFADAAELPNPEFVNDGPGVRIILVDAQPQHEFEVFVH